MLGLAAIAGSVANPPERAARDGAATTETQPDTTAEPPPATVPAAAEPTVVRFPAAPRPQARTVATGTPAQVVVEVGSPAVVEIPSLGLTEAAEPLTPATFDVLVYEPGSHEIRLLPADRDERPSTAGTLTVVPRR